MSTALLPDPPPDPATPVVDDPAVRVLTWRRALAALPALAALVRRAHGARVPF